MKAHLLAPSIPRVSETVRRSNLAEVSEQSQNARLFGLSIQQTPGGRADQSLRHISILAPDNEPSQIEMTAGQEHIAPVSVLVDSRTGSTEHLAKHQNASIWSLANIAIRRDEQGPAYQDATRESGIAASLFQGNVIQRKPVESAYHQQNNTSLPDRLKTGIESLSGLSLDDVRVHYNSFKPDQMDALAYAQDRDIYVGPGQEKHLAHEAWHVVQQKRGHVRPSAQIRGVAMNNDQVLEREADVMGERALHFLGHHAVRPDYFQPISPRFGIGSMPLFPAPVSNAVVQRKPKVDFLDTNDEAQVEADITGNKFQDALNKLMATTYFSKLRPSNVQLVTFDPTYKDYGIAEQDRNDPKTHNEVDIRIGAEACKDISILVSTLQHELIHAEQYTKPSLNAKGIKGSPHVYGYAKEGGSSSSKYIEAAQEVETHCWEIEHAMQTKVPKDFLEKRGEALLKYWTKLHSAGTAYGVTKKSKPRAYYDELKPRVEQAFSILKNSFKINVDNTYFKYKNYYGLKIK